MKQLNLFFIFSFILVGTLSLTSAQGLIYSSVESATVTPHMYALATDEIPLTTVEQWYNITWNTSISYIEGNLEFENNRTLIIQEDGNYLITFGIQVIDGASSPSASIASRVALNGNQLGGSYAEMQSDKQNFQKWLEKSSYGTFEEGDRLEMQVISSDDTVSVSGLNTFNTGYGSIAYGWIEKIH